MLGIIILVLLSFTEIALAQAAAPAAPQLPELPGFLDTLLDASFLAKLIPILIGVQLALLGIGEGLTRIAVLTENKWDNRLAGWISNAAWVLGVLCGKFGYGTPKLVIEEKAKQAANDQEPPKSA